MMKRYFVDAITFVCLFSLFFFIGCGDPEDTDSIVIPDELYDTSQLTYDISDAELQELMALDVPTNWEQTKDSELRAKYYHAHLLKQFGNIPAVHIVAARERERILTGVMVFATTDDMVDFEKAQYVLWPTKHNRDRLEVSLKRKMMEDTDDPELFAKIYREQLVEQHGDIPEVEVVVDGETKLWFGGFRFPGDEEEYIAFLEAKYVLWPGDLKLRRIEKYRKALAEGTPFHLVDLNDDN